MSSRRLLQGRHRERPAEASSSRRNENTAVELPPYESPSCPLNDQARRALADLSHRYDTRKYDEQLKNSLNFLKSAVATSNDRLTDRKGKLVQLKRRREEADEEKTDRERVEEKAVKRLEDEVPGLTADCEKAVRKVVDLIAAVEDDKTALTQMAQSVQKENDGPQGRRTRQAENAEMDEVADGAEPAEIENPLEQFQESRDKLAREYARKSLYQRYALDNEYASFKRIWHDSTHDEGIPVPDATRWFTHDDGDVVPANDAGDDGFVVAGEKTSLKCPLTLQIMKEPYGSKKCKHVFEKAAIAEYLGNRTKKCPQAGCDADISPKDLYLDQVVLRRIKRAKANEARNYGRSDGLDEDVDEDGDQSMLITQEQNIKREKGTTRRGKRRQVDDVEDDEGE